MASPNVLTLCSFNMFGFRNGANILKEICGSHILAAVQEHWLREDEFDKLALIHHDFTFYAASGMKQAAANAILKGRPYGGVAFLWHKSINGFIVPISSSPDGRCIVIQMRFGNMEFLLFNVYFPCYDNSQAYKDEISLLTAFIESTLTSNRYSEAIIMGDMNFDITPGHAGYDIFNSLLCNANMSSCDDLVNGSIFTPTYFNEALKASSRIDHFFVSNELKHCVNSATVIVNDALCFSDHRPISLHLDLAKSSLYVQAINVQRTTIAQEKPKTYRLRWDKGSLSDYYNTTRDELARLCFDESLACCSDNCSSDMHKSAINKYYLDIVRVLTESERACIPRIPCNALKPFWNDFLDELKQKSIFWHSIWCNAGRPQSGHIYIIKNNCKFKYKMAIKKAFADYENQYNDDILKHFLNKKTPEFWKSWACKMHSKVEKDVFIDGSKDDLHVANAFATQFKSVYYNSGDNENAKSEFCNLVSAMPDDVLNPSTLLTVELIDVCMRKLKLGKALGGDGLGGEHLMYACPTIVIHLRKLFLSMAKHCYVPDDFGGGTIIPLIKDKLGNANDVNNYRGITLIPVISKLFELVLCEICNPFLQTDDLQFGFKKGLGCTSAIFLLQESVEYFLANGSSVYAASLDIKKAFDTVNHFRLFSSLIKSNVPKWVVLILANWYSKLFVCVRWRNTLSSSFSVLSGVRQGSAISPALFNKFVNDFVVNLKNCNAGCVINGRFVGAILYADDLIIISPTVSGLQKMLSCCEVTSNDIDLEFNCKKCGCIAIGPASKYCISGMSLCNDVVSWSNSFKYLGVNFVAGKKLTVDINPIKRKFYVACNCILGKAKCLDDLVKLSLMESYCLPMLTYATVSMKLSSVQVSDLNACWNSVYRRIFGFNKWESVRVFINGIGRLDFQHLRVYLCLKFFSRGIISANIPFANAMNLFCHSDAFIKLCCDTGLRISSLKEFNSISFAMLKKSVLKTFGATCISQT